MGAAARAALEAESVDISRLRVVDEPTGVALIAVDRRGRNQISVAPGANHTVTDVSEDLDAVGPGLVVASCEIPLRAVTSAQKWCTANEVPLVVNPAPAVPRLGLYASTATVMTPNRGEVTILRSGAADPLSAARAMVERHPTLTMVVTLGEDGALVVDATGYDFVEAPRVDAVDTTGAGDCFNGVLAAAMADGLSVREAAARAATAAALSVKERGAREGMPTRDQIDSALAGRA
jgi:ribokinase